MPSAWRTELATSAMPPMQITTPPPVAGTGRMTRASGTMARGHQTVHQRLAPGA